jgi:hypothetical protein
MTEPTPISAKKKSMTIVWSLGVVVLVLLCLGAIATPKFGGLGRPCKAKQSQAMTNLSGIFTAEKAFYGEHEYYTTDLVSVDWTPDGSPLYAFGFASPSSAGPDPGIPALDPTRRTTVDTRVAGTAYSLDRMRAAGGRALSDDDFQEQMPSATASSSAFLVVAIGNVDSDETLDVWTIDHVKNLTVVTNDCTD